MRIASSSHCSSSSRRVCRLTAASRYSIAAQDISRYLRRLQQWIRIGAAAAASQPSIGRLASPKAKSGEQVGTVEMGMQSG